MDKTLEVTLTQTRHREPLVVIESAVGNGSELTPPQLRRLAAALLQAAEAAEQRPMGQKAFRAIKAQYEI